VARKPRAPTPAELTAIRARERIRGLGAAREREAARASRPRTPRKPTPRERNIERSRSRVRSIRSEVERKTPDLQSEKAVASYQASPAYGKALVTAALTKQIHDELRARQKTGRLNVGTFDPKGLDANRVPRELQTRGKSLVELATLAKALTDKPRTQGLVSRVVKGDTRDPLRNYITQGQKAKAASSGSSKAVQKLFEYSLRPVNAIANVAKQDVIAAKQGRGLGSSSPGEIADAAWRGLSGKEKTTFSDVLKEGGVKKGAGPLGLALDIVSDPTTYITFGTASVASKVARQEALTAARQAAEAYVRANVKADMTAAQRKLVEAQARERGQQAAHVVTTKALKRQGERAHRGGVNVKFAGKDIPLVTRGVVRGTSKANQGVRAAVRKVSDTETGRQLRRGTRLGASELHAGVRKAGQTKAQQQAEKAAQRETRAQNAAIARHVTGRSSALLGRLSKAERRKVIDAIEAGPKGVRGLKGQATEIKTARTLNPNEYVRRRLDVQDPDRLHTVARRVEDDLKYLHRIGTKSGLLGTGVGAGARRRVMSTTGVGRQGQQGVRSEEKVKTALKQARAEQAQARITLRNLPASAKPSERQAARRGVRDSQQRVENLRQRLNFVRAQKSATHARTVKTEPTLKRMRGEAQGYFPRLQNEQVAQRSALARYAEDTNDQPIPRAQVGANKPDVGSAQRREHRTTRSEQEKTEAGRARTAALSEDVGRVLSAYGSAIARGSSARGLNTRLVQEFGQPLRKTGGYTEAELLAMDKAGQGVYRVSRGQLERLSPSDYGHINRVAGASGRTAPGRVLRTTDDGRKLKEKLPQLDRGAQYAVIPDDVVKRIRDKQPTYGQGSKVVQGYDAFQSGFKGLALSTPGYLLRNFVGDAYNAWGDKNFWQLARDTAKGSKALNDLGKHERALTRFQRELPESKRTIKLSTKQAENVARALGMKPGEVGRKIPAMAVALLAERMGVIRQGRFLELMSERSSALERPKGPKAWETAVKRTEDSVRIGTFLGDLQRGMSPREAAAHSSKVHFDYGDLTSFEKGVSRRAMPFYTFSSRNIPLQAERVLTRPGKLATLAKAQEEGRKSAGLPEDYREGQSPYEKRQLGIPIKLGDKTFTISAGLPFTDLGDVAGMASAVAPGGEPLSSTVGIPSERVGELLTPLKTIPELSNNYSLFFRDAIQDPSEPYTRAPGWAILLAKGNDPASKKFREQTGMVPDYEPPESTPGHKGTWGWPRKVDYTFRQVPGAVGAFTKIGPLGVQGGNARAMKPWQQIAAFMGPRVIEYERNSAQINKLYDDYEKVDVQRRMLMRRANPAGGGRINTDNPTPDFEALTEQMSKIQEELDALKRTTRPTGYVGGELQTPPVKLTGPAARRAARATARTQSGSSAAARRIARAKARQGGSNAAALRRIARAR
jgi:hypothetical protein